MAVVGAREYCQAFDGAAPLHTIFNKHILICLVAIAKMCYYQARRWLVVLVYEFTVLFAFSSQDRGLCLRYLFLILLFLFILLLF